MIIGGGRVARLNFAYKGKLDTEDAEEDRALKVTIACQMARVSTHDATAKFSTYRGECAVLTLIHSGRRQSESAGSLVRLVSVSRLPLVVSVFSPTIR